jgi:radical SAM/Cys-rich protein
MINDFRKTVEDLDARLLRFEGLKTLQVNLGDRCNQECAHCHVMAGPNGTRVMGRAVMQKITDFLGRQPALAVDITGGCPEMNPDFKFFVENIYGGFAKEGGETWPRCASGYATQLQEGGSRTAPTGYVNQESDKDKLKLELQTGAARQMTVRTNLTVFFEPGLEWLGEWYRQNKVVLVGSLPCYTQENVDRQRGRDVFQKSIKAIQMLNHLGYGISDGLELDLVYNPGGDFLPGSQQQLEAYYNQQLFENFGIKFSRLFTIVNAPIGRFRKYLEANGTLEKYMELLSRSFNPQAAANIMCRGLISVDYRGILYNCDFNQALDLPIRDSWGRPVSIDNIEDILSKDFEVITGLHCYCCTAGAGSSCTGATVK